MSNPAQLKQSMRYQKWFEEVQAYKARPKGMSSEAWCEANGIKPATFYCRLRKIQQLYVDSLEQTSIVPVKSVEPPAVVEPTFVELAPAPSSKKVSTSSGVATILCGSIRIEISEDISEQFLLKLIEVASHAK